MNHKLQFQFSKARETLSIDDYAVLGWCNQRTSIFKSYYRLFFSYHAYCAVFSTIPKTWLEEMNEFIEQYYKIDNRDDYI